MNNMCLWVWLFEQSNNDLPSAITIGSPENITYYESSVSLDFSSKDPLSWIGYRLDNGALLKLQVTQLLLVYLWVRTTITLYVMDKAGTAVVFQTIYFAIQEFDIVTVYLVLVAAVSVTVIIAGAGVWVYFKKDKKHL